MATINLSHDFTFPFYFTGLPAPESAADVLSVAAGLLFRWAVKVPRNDLGWLRGGVQWLLKRRLWVLLRISCVFRTLVEFFFSKGDRLFCYFRISFVFIPVGEYHFTSISFF